MSWTEESILAAFPRANSTYYIQFIQEPKEVHKKGKYGPWIELAVSLQLFSIDEDGGFHYMGSVAAEHKPCVLESLTEFGPDIVTRLIEVRGFQHGKHVDLELVDSWDRISANVESGPSKPADSSELLRLGERQQRGVHATPTEAGSERGQPGAGGMLDTAVGSAGAEQPGQPLQQLATEPPAAPCPHTAVRLIENEQGETEGFQCKACGERVG